MNDINPSPAPEEPVVEQATSDPMIEKRLIEILFPSHAPHRCSLAQRGKNGCQWVFNDERNKKWRVIIHASRWAGKFWVTVSVGGRSYLPPVEVMRGVKQAFLGPEAEAIQVLPSMADHAEVYAFKAGYWFHCLNGSGLPDFFSELAPKPDMESKEINSPAPEAA